MYNKEEISSRGIAYQSGLEVYASHTVYGDEILNWGNALAYGSQLGSDTTTVVSGDVVDAQVQALISGGAANNWRRYNTTTGTNHYVGTPPTSGSGFFTLNAASDGNKISYAGMHQQLSTEIGGEYQIDIINTIDADFATLNVNTYFPKFDFTNNYVSYKESSSNSTSYPMKNTSTCISSFSFTAVSTQEIVVIFLTKAATETLSTVAVNITNISVRKKDTILQTVYSQDFYGNSQKVLRRTNELRRFNT